MTINDDKNIKKIPTIKINSEHPTVKMITMPMQFPLEEYLNKIKKRHKKITPSPRNKKS